MTLQISHIYHLKAVVRSVVDPKHFSADPDLRIRDLDQWIRNMHTCARFS
jgi:hypothetical protein